MQCPVVKEIRFHYESWTQTFAEMKLHMEYAQESKVKQLTVNGPYK